MRNRNNLTTEINKIQQDIYAGAKTALASYYFTQFKSIATAPIQEVIKQNVLRTLFLAVIKYSSPDKQELVNSIKNYYEQQETECNSTRER